MPLLFCQPVVALSVGVVCPVWGRPCFAHQPGKGSPGSELRVMTAPLPLCLLLLLLPPPLCGAAALAGARPPPPSTLVVIGGGAAGFFGAIRAASCCPDGLRVVVLEASASVLTKVKISGGGRCNVCHDDTKDDRLIASGYPRGERALS